MPAATRCLALASCCATAVLARTRYHAPSDDLSQPMDFEATAQLTRNLFLIGYAVAQEEERPRWNPGDFYGKHFGHGL